jgi:hypothetical protein
MLPVVLQRCVKLGLSKEEHRFGMFQTRILKRILGCETGEAEGR